MHRRFLVLCALSMAAAAPPAWAQAAPGGAKADPQDAGAAVPQAIYRSALADYRAFSDEEPASWKEANDLVGRIGGWRAYAREAQAAGPAASPAPPGSQATAPAGRADAANSRGGARQTQ